ncbi:T9SS type A sorting domain-containing protein [bacterium]|nr:MAG: T9SS type A sorting domain-containing protein [bacterium]
MVRGFLHNSIAGFLLVGIFTANLFAIPAFTESIVSSLADGAWGVHVADVDGDGDLDIIRASLYDDTVAWYENTATGYTGHVITASANGAIAVYAEDIDSDGDMDILSANYYEAKIAWYENNGSESFTAHTISTSMSYAYDVYAADIDLDGDMDVVGAAYSSDQVVWFENNGSESFTSHTVTTAADGAASVYVEDVDSDGDMDILSASINDDEVAWYENNGSEIFTTRTITTGANGANTVFAIDVDSDGDIDVLSSSSYDDKIAWYENNGSQGFTARTISTTADGAFDLYALDFDQDGDVDVLSASLYDHEITLYENNGSQTFAAYVIGTAVNGTRSVYAGDMDNDGDTDIIATALNDDQVIVYTNETSGLATASFVASTVSTSADGARSVFAADLDNDGDMDIVSASQEDDAIAWYENNGAVNPSWTVSDIATSADGANAIYVADMDNDGDMDIVSASGADDAISWYENNGAADPSWTAADIATSADNAMSVFVADMDGDGDMDIVSASYNDDAIAWYENDGAANPSWTATDIATSADGARSVFAADMDGDGDMDIVSASKNDDAIAWYENDGAANPSWTAVDIATSADGAMSVFAADMDGDGDMDIVSASGIDDAIAWYENDGAANPSWTATDIVTNADEARSVFAADMDGDGDMDIVSASVNDDKIAWYQNSAGRNAPQVTSVTSSQDNGSYGIGAEIPIFVNYSDQVLVTGSPQLTLETGDTDAVLSYISGNGTGQLLFTYTVAAGHATADLNYQSSSALSLDGGTIKDARGNNNNASLVLPAPGAASSLGANKDLVIDTNAPIVTSVTSTNRDSTYGAGDTINVSITFDDTVDVTTGTIGCGDFLISSLPFSAQYSNAGQPNNWDVSGSDGSDIAYTLNLSEATTISITTCAAYSNYDTKLQIFTANDQCTPVATSYYNDDYSCSYSGLRASLPSSQLEAGQYYVVVDGYSGATGNYQIDISVVSGRNSAEQNTTDMNLPGMDDYPRFTNTVGYDSEYEITKLRADGYMSWEVDEFLNNNDIDPIFTLRSGGTGTPKITLETGAGDSAAYYISGHGTNIISFQYIVATGDSSSDLDYVSVDALDVNSGTIRDASGNDAILTLPIPGAAGSLSANKALVVDGFGPLVSSVSSTIADSVYNVGSVIPIAISFNENVVVIGNPQLTMETGASDAIASYASGSGSNTITFNYTTAAGENSADLDYQDSTALILNGGTITDAYGNAANLILPAPGAEGSLGANKEIIVDGGAPVVNNITSTSLDGTYNLGDIIPITVAFSEALTVTGTPQLEINTGGTSLSFDGNGDYVRMTGFNPSITDFTLSLWVKSNSYSSSNKNIFQQMDASGTGRSIVYVRSSSNQFATFLGGGERLSGVVSEVNRWYNVVLVHNNSANTITWFINGVQANTNNSNVETTVGDFLLGVHKAFSSSSYFNGLIDEIAIWDSQLDSTEIIDLYNSGSSISAAVSSGNYTSSSDLIRYYTMDEGLGNIIFDHSSVGVNGTLYNGTWGSSPLRGDVVDYSSGSGTSSLTFDYTVSNGHYSTDLDYTRSQALFLNGGTIKEASGNDAVLTMPIPGTVGSLGYSKAIHVDGVVPVVTSVTSTANNEAYSLDEDISITISFDDLVTVTGVPQLTLETGSSDATADYSSGTGTHLLTFIYTVSTGDTSSDLSYTGTNALSLNSGTMRDASGNNVNLTLPTPGDSLSLSGSKAIIIDGVSPSVINVTSSMENTFYNVGDTLDISVQFDENMTVGTASLGCGDFLITSLPYTHSHFNTGQGNNWDVSGSDNEDVAYTLHLSEPTTISVTTCNSATNYDTKLQIFTANGQCVGTSAGYYNDDYSCSYNNLYATLPSSQLSAGTYYIVVDGYSTRNGNYTVSVEDISSRATAEASDYDSQYEIDKLIDDGYQQWEIRDMIADQNVDEPIYSFSRTGTGIPQLTLETGVIDAIATYDSGDGNTFLSFRYVVGMDQNSNDLDYASTTALGLNGGTITDAAGNPATLTLPTPGGIGSLGANKDIVIDGGVPQVTSVTSSVSNGNYITGDLIPIDVVFTENVTVSDTPQIQLSTGGFALDLDGSDDYAFIPNHSSLQFGANDYSISVWFNIDAIGATRQIFCKRGGPGNYEIQVNSAGRLSAWAPTGFSGSTTLTANTWYNVILTRVNGTAYLYLNGVLEASRSSSGTQSSSNGLSIGRDSYGGERFNGDIDEFAIWNTGLSAQEALTLYNTNASLDLTSNSSSYTSSSNLVMYLRLNEGSGNTSVDATGNGHDATLNNGATWAVSQLGGTVVNYSLGSGTDTLTFNYTVLDGNFSIDLDYTNTNALILNGGIIRDNGGNNAILTLPIPGSLGSLSANKNIVVDGSVPGVTDISSSNADGVYIVGDTLVIGITFSDIINVTGVPQLSLNLGNVNGSAGYISGAGTRILNFQYIISIGQASSDLDYDSTTSLTLNNGTINDQSGNRAVLILPEPGSSGSLADAKSLQIDGVVPIIDSVSTYAINGIYSTGDSMDISVSFNENVLVTGTPQLSLETGATDVLVNYRSGSGSPTLMFRYMVGLGNSSNDLDYMDTTALSLNGGFIRDESGNNAILTLTPPGSPGSLSANKSLVIDGAAPVVSAVTSSTLDSAYIVGDTVAIDVVFSEVVTVSGTPTLTLETGQNDAVLYYNTGSGTSTLGFQYIVEFGHFSSDLNYIDSSAFSLNGGTIRDAARNNAQLLLPEADSTNSLAGNKALVIDGIIPIINSVSSNVTDSLYKLGDTLGITIMFNEVVHVVGSPQISLETGNLDAVVNYTRGSGTSILTFLYTVSAGEVASDLDYVGTIALGLNGGSIKDAAGNNVIMTLPAPGANGSLSNNKTLVIDGIVPTVFSVSSTSVDSVYKIGDTIPILITFSETVLVDTLSGKPRITLETGTQDTYVEYHNGSGTAVLSFSYTVASGNISNDLGYLSDSALVFNSGTIIDSAGSLADLSLAAPGAAGSLAANKNLFIDGLAPSVTSISSNEIDTTYSISDTLGITVTFSEAITVSGIPQLTVETGDSDALANYISGTGTNVLTFQFIVANGYTSVDLDIVSSSALSLNSGSIVDAVGNTAILSLPNPGDAGSLGYNKSIILDANPPSISLAMSDNANGSYKMGDTLDISVVFNEEIIVVGVPQLTLETGATDAAVNYLSGSGSTTLIFRYIIASGHVNADLSYISTSALGLNNGSIKDVAGNSAVLTLPTPGVSNSLSSNMNLNVEGVLPAIPSGLIATPGHEQTRLDWTANSDQDLASYKVYGGSSSNPTTLLATISTGTETYTQTGLTNGSIYYYRIAAVDNIGNNSNTTSDVSSLSHNLDVASSLNFDGTDDFASGTNSDDFDITDELTVSAWIKADVLKNATILNRMPDSGSNGYRLSVRSNGEIWALAGSGESNAKASTAANYYSAGTNYFVSGVYKDGQYVKLYINGNLIESVTTDIEFSTDLGLEIARWVNSSDDEYFDGNIDEIGVWNKALTQEELLQLYSGGGSTDLRSNNGNYSSSSNLKGYWRFSESTGFTLYDVSTKGQHASFSGAVWNTSVIDVARPIVTSVSATADDGIYGIGDTLLINVGFNEAVTVTGTPQLTIETGDNDAALNYISGTGTGTLNFQYIISSGHTNFDLDYVSNSSLELNNGSIKDAATNNAILTLPDPDSTGSLANTKDIIVDGIPASVLSVSSTSDNSAYKIGDDVIITVQFNEAVTVTGVPQLTLETGTNDGVASYSIGSGTNTLSFIYTIIAGHENSDLEYNSSTAFSLNNSVIQDLAGNNVSLTLPTVGETGSLATNKDIVIDGVFAMVDSVSAITANGYFKAGDTLNITVHFDENVNVTAIPQLALETGSNDATIYYTSGSGTSILTFQYIADEGHLNTDLGYVNTLSLSLNNGLIRDIAGNNATLTLAEPGASGSLSGNRALVVDAVSPSVVSVSSSQLNGMYNIGDTLEIAINFSEVVTVDTSNGFPQIALETGAQNSVVDYSRGSGTNILLFDYIVVRDHVSDDLDYISTSAFALNDGVISDLSGNSAVLTLPAPSASGSLSANKNLVIDGIIPTIISSISTNLLDGTYKIGDTLGIAVNFSENVAVTGVPQLTMETGTSDGIADYASGNNTSTIIFNYIVTQGHFTNDLDYASASALSLNSGSILDLAGNNANLNLPVPGTASSFSASKAIVIDGIVPSITSVSSPDDNGTLTFGTTVGITVTFDEVVSITGTPQLLIETGDNDATLDYSSGSGSPTITFNYTVAASHLSSDLGYISSSSLTLNGGSIRDVAGNNAGLILADPDSTGSLSTNKNFIVDGIVPVMTSVTSSLPDGNYMVGDTIPVVIVFDDNVHVIGSPQVSLVTYSNNENTIVDYSSGSGSSFITFNYVVGLGHQSNNLDYSNTTALSLNGGSIRDVSGNNASLTLIPPGSDGSLSANKSLVVDGGAPVVESVTSSSGNSTYIVGDTIITNITFSEPVIVTGVPTLSLETGDNDAISNYTSGSGTSIINFSYIISEGHYSGDLGYVDQNALELNQGSINDAAGNNMVLLLPEPDSTGSLSSNKDLIIDGILPFVNSVSSLDSNGTYIFGDTIYISIDFSEQVNITGSPQLILETGSNDVSIPYLSGTGSTALVFRYIIESGHSSLDLGYQTDSSLVLNGGSINDFAGNRSLLNLPEIGSIFSISGSSDIYVDGDVPNAPDNLIATPGLGKVDLTWVENTETDLAYYKVYADTVSNPSTYIGDGFIGLQKFSHNNITDGSIWHYRISAVDLAGNESEKTSAVFAMPHDPVNEQCLSFDGDDDYIDTPLASNLLPLTISVLFKPDVNSGEQSIVDSDIGGRYGQSIILGYQDQDNSVDVQYHNGFYDSPFTYSPDKWYHAVAVYDTGIALLYMNGELVGSETFTQATPDGSNFRIGRHNSGDPQWYDGKIDEVIIWNDTLSLNEIQAINSNPLNINLNENSDQYQSSSSLLGYWKFGESSGRTIYDISGNGNHATINGATWDSEAVDMVPPEMPENLVTDPGNRQITLSWNKNQEEDLYQYLVYGGMEQFPSNIIARNSNPNDTTVVIDSLQNGTTYYYRISAIDYSGLESQKTLDVFSTPSPQKYEINQNGAGDFISIQSAINQSFDDDTLIVFSGTYNENIDLLGKALIVASEYYISGDTSQISSTIIDGQSNGSVVTISNVDDSQIKLVGLTIQNGYSQYGGAVYSINSNLFLESLIILNNNSTENGGGLYLNGGNPNLSSITFSNNAAAAYGGAIYMQNNSSAILNKLTIDNNSAENGAGIAMSSSNPTMTNLVLSNNSADSTGGAIALYSNSNPGLYNIVIHNNYAGQYGGAIYSTNSNVTIGNSTIVDNQSEFHGGALNLSDGSNVEAINSIIYNNVPDQMYISDINDLLNISHSNIEGGLYGINYSHETSSSSESLVSWDSSNIDINPLFNNINNNDYRLSDYSMSIGVGDISTSFSVDINAVNRPAPLGTAPDLGAYENLRSVPDVWLTLANDQFFMNEDSDLLFNPVSNDSIVNFHLVNLAILDSAKHGSVAIISDSTITYQPNENYFGKDTIVYAFDNVERRDSAITVITIYMLDDDPPVITSSSTSFAVEDQTYNYSYEGYDPDMSTNRWEILNEPEWLVMSNDSIYGTPLEGDLDTSFLLIYYDSYFSDTLDVGIYVTTVNDPPEIKSPDSIIVDESDYYVYHASAEDPEDSTLIWTFNNLPSWMNTTGDSTFGSPNEGAQDTSFQIIVSDGEYLDTVLVFVEVIPYNDLPVITSSDSLLAIEDEFVSFNFAGYDPEGLPISWAVDHLPSWLSMEGDDVSGTPIEGDLDTIFTLYASDGLLNDSLEINVYVNPVNDLPTITSHVVDTAFVDEYFVYYPSAIDPEDSTLIWELYDGPPWMTLVGDSIYGMVSRGSDDTFFTIIVSDGELTDTMLVNLEVIDINYPPEITFMPLQGEYHNNINLSLYLYDFDDDELDYQISYTTDGIQWNDATTVEQSGDIGLDTMSIIWYSMADLDESFHPNVQLKILAYDLQSDSLQTPEDTSSIYISDVFTIDNYIGSVAGVMSLTQDEYYGDIRLTYSIADSTNDHYAIILRYSVNNGNSWNLATLQDSLYNIGSLEYSDTLIWNSDEDLFNLDTSLLLQLSISDEWQSSSSELISIHFDNQVLPLLTEISPDTGEYIYWYDRIILTFTGQMNLDSYSNGIILQSNQRGFLDYTAQFIQDGEVAHLTIYPEESYYADEQIQVFINQQLRDIWDNPFDGNNNGDPDGSYDHDSLSFSINILGDYDRSGLVNFEDLVSFQQYWWSDTTVHSHEVGPALGEPPYMQLHPDTLMNFEDLMVFIQMWNWSNGFENDGAQLTRNMIYDKYNASLSVGYPDKKIGQENDYIFLNLNLDSIQSIGSIGIEFSYDPEIIQFINHSSRLDQSWTSLFYHDSINHRMIFQVADLNKEQRVQPINKQFKFAFKRLMDADTEIEWMIDMRNRLGQITQIFTQSYQFNTIAPLPEEYALHQNYPNPFNPTTTIRYDLPEDSNVRISIYNLLGQEVKLLTNKFEAAGYRTIRWHGKDKFNQDVSAGIYFLLMETNTFTSTRKLILLK